MLNAELIQNEIRDGLTHVMESHRQVVDNILASEAKTRNELIEIAQMAIEGWRLATDENDKDFALAIARLENIKERTN